MLQPGCLYETSKSRLSQLQPPAARNGQPGPCKHGSTAQRNGPQFGCSRKLSYFRHDSQEFRGRIARCTTCFTEIFVAKKRRGSVHCVHSQLANLLEKKSRNGNLWHLSWTGEGAKHPIDSNLFKMMYFNLKQHHETTLKHRETYRDLKRNGSCIQHRQKDSIDTESLKM